MQTGVSAVELQPTISGEPGVGVGVEQGWGGMGSSGGIPCSRSTSPPSSPPPAGHLGEHKAPSSWRGAQGHSHGAAGLAGA